MSWNAVVVPEIDPRWGGPSVSVPALARAMHRLDPSTRLYFVATHREPDWPDCFMPARPAPPRCLRRSAELRAQLRAEPLAVVHHHGLWLPSLRYASGAARHWRCPLVISPRGMLSPYALRRSRLKKLLARMVIHPGTFQRAAGWHATSDLERDEIRAAGFRQPIVVAPNGIDTPPWNEPADREAWLARHPELAGQRVLLFFSRLHSKKGVRPLLRMWSELESSHRDWRLLIAGIPEEHNFQQLRDHARALGIAERVTIADPTGLPKPYGLAELYVLPTQSENFGLTIGEALASGVPVLTTRGTPWHELDERECGRCVTLESFPAALDALLKLDASALSAWGGRGREWVRAGFSWDQQANDLLQFYGTLR